MQPGRQACGDGQIRIGVGAWQTVLHPSSRRCTRRDAQAGCAIVVGPAGVIGRSIGLAQALIGIHVGREQRCEISHAGLLTRDKVTKRVSRLAICTTEDVYPGVCCYNALMKMHRTARRVSERLGHADHNKPVLERDLLEQVLEQKGLVGEQQRVAMQQVDLELADAHLVHHRVTRQTQRRHAGVYLGEKRPQAIVRADTER